MENFFHSVTLNESKCTGCTNCIKRCPTEAIRVRNGKAEITSELCIDCGECIRVCPYHAKRAKYDDISLMNNFKHKIALPPPTLYGQFNNLEDIDYVLTGLLDMGFDSVFEVARAAEIVSDATRALIKQGKLKKPIISSACPAIVRLIRVKYPNLCDNVMQLQAPMEVAARFAKEEVHEKTGLPMEEIGAFFITPCPAKVTDVRAPLINEKSAVDGAFSMSEIYPLLLSKMNRVDNPTEMSKCGIIGLSWAASGGEATALIKENYLAADAIENVIGILDELEEGKLQNVDFVELNVCRSGCVGGVLTVENPYVAKARIQTLRKYLPVSGSKVIKDDVPKKMIWENKLDYADVFQLSDDIEQAMEMMGKIEEVCDKFPNLDCGACGAPSCRALAEDIVKGHSNAEINDCIFILKEELKNKNAAQLK